MRCAASYISLSKTLAPSDAPSLPPPYLLLQVPSVGREDSLAELEHSFNRQVLSGEITADIIDEEPRAPSLGREDSLAQLESSFKKQVWLLSGFFNPRKCTSSSHPTTRNDDSPVAFQNLTRRFLARRCCPEISQQRSRKDQKAPVTPPHQMPCPWG